MTKSSLLRTRQTKIVATMGPSSDTREMIEKLFIAGVDVFRLNFSHGTHAEHAQRLAHIRDIEKAYGHPITILADLQGPKLRVGQIENGGIDLSPGQSIRLDLDPTIGNSTRVPLLHPEIITAMHAGSTLLCDDGKVRLEVTEKGEDYLMTKVIAGKRLLQRKGVNVPDVVLPIPALTEKDRVDLDAALSMGADYIALSFVQKPEDVTEARAIIGDRAGICVKVEKPSALDCLDDLIALSDCIMLARGDLGVEIPAEKVPSTQKRVSRAVRAAGKPLIIATQMLESMIDSPTPTRAEASDVATAVYDGTDAVMLSAETANGSYPLEAVSMMDRICSQVEKDPLYPDLMRIEFPSDQTSAHDAITRAAFSVAHDIGAKAVVCYSHSGKTARRMARHRPASPILTLTPFEAVARQLVLGYATHPVIVPQLDQLAQAVETAVQVAKSEGLAKQGDKLVMTAGVPLGHSGTTNIVRMIDVT